MTRMACRFILHVGTARLAWRSVKSLRNPSSPARVGVDNVDSPRHPPQYLDRFSRMDKDEILQLWCLLAFHTVWTQLGFDAFCSMTVPFYHYFKMILLLAMFLPGTRVPNFLFETMLVPGMDRIHRLLDYDWLGFLMRLLAEARFLPLRMVDLLVPGIIVVVDDIRERESGRQRVYGEPKAAENVAEEEEDGTIAEPMPNRIDLDMEREYAKVCYAMDENDGRMKVLDKDNNGASLPAVSSISEETEASSSYEGEAEAQMTETEIKLESTEEEAIEKIYSDENEAATLSTSLHKNQSAASSRLQGDEGIGRPKTLRQRWSRRQKSKEVNLLQADISRSVVPSASTRGSDDTGACNTAAKAAIRRRSHRSTNVAAAAARGTASATTREGKGEKQAQKKSPLQPSTPQGDRKGGRRRCPNPISAPATRKSSSSNNASITSPVAQSRLHASSLHLRKFSREHQQQRSSNTPHSRHDRVGRDNGGNARFHGADVSTEKDRRCRTVRSPRARRQGNTEARADTTSTGTTVAEKVKMPLRRRQCSNQRDSKGTRSCLPKNAPVPTRRRVKRGTVRSDEETARAVSVGENGKEAKFTTNPEISSRPDEAGESKKLEETETAETDSSSESGIGDDRQHLGGLGLSSIRTFITGDSSIRVRDFLFDLDLPRVPPSHESCSSSVCSSVTGTPLGPVGKESSSATATSPLSADRDLEARRRRQQRRMQYDENLRRRRGGALLNRDVDDTSSLSSSSTRRQRAVGSTSSPRRDNVGSNVGSPGDKGKRACNLECGSQSSWDRNAVTPLRRSKRLMAKRP